MFSVHTARPNLETQHSAAILDLCLKKTREEKSRDYCVVIVFFKLRFKMFSVHTNSQSWCF